MVLREGGVRAGARWQVTGARLEQRERWLLGWQRGFRNFRGSPSYRSAVSALPGAAPRCPAALSACPAALSACPGGLSACPGSLSACPGALRLAANSKRARPGKHFVRRGMDRPPSRAGGGHPGGGELCRGDVRGDPGGFSALPGAARQLQSWARWIRAGAEMTRAASCLEASGPGLCRGSAIGQTAIPSSVGPAGAGGPGE